MDKIDHMTAPTLLDLLYIKRGFLSKEQCDIIINEYESSIEQKRYETSTEASTGIEKFSSFKRVSSKIGSQSFNLIHKTVEAITNEYHDYLDSFNAFHVTRKKTLVYPHNYRILKYEKGASIHPHIDHDTAVYGSCTINLNEEYEGGDFAFWFGKHKVKLGTGDVMIWPADFFWVHEVEPIKSGVRYSANTFLCSRPMYMPEEIKLNIRNLDSVDKKRSRFQVKYN